MATVDPNGRTVYVNANPPLSRPSRSTKRKPSKRAPIHVARLQAPGTAQAARTTSTAGVVGPGTGTASGTAVVTPDGPVASGADPQIDALPFDGLVRQSAAAAQVDPRLVHAIIQQESEYNPHAISAKGAVGLMQLIPATARRFGVSNPFDPAENVQGGVSYLRYLLDLFGGDVPLSLAAYNAGENAVLRADGIPDFHETRAYVRRVSERYGLWDGSENSWVSRGTRAGRTATDSSSRPDSMLPVASVYRYVDAFGVVHYSQ